MFGLDAIPWLFNFTEGLDPEFDCWPAQCEILLTMMLGAQAQDEDSPPNDPDDVDPNHFHFHGFGQPGQGPPPPPNPPQNDANPANLQPMGRIPWPNQVHEEQIIAQVQDPQMGQAA